MADETGSGWIPRVKNLEEDAQSLRVELKAALGRIVELEKLSELVKAALPKAPAPPGPAPARRGNWA